jgi:hypothetical protein
MDGQEVNRSPTHLLHLAGLAAERLFAGNAMGFATPRQLAVLIAVSKNEGLNQTDVVLRTGIDRATLSEIISRLLREGLLRRRRLAPRLHLRPGARVRIGMARRWNAALCSDA